MDELQRGLWGYKKDSVYRYIVSMEEKASMQLAEKDEKLSQMEAEMKRQLAELEGEGNRQIAELKATVAALRAENEALKENQIVVFHTMMEAQKYADQIRADSDLQSQEAQKRLYDAVNQQKRQLEDYLAQVQQIRALLQEKLQGFDGALEDTEHVLTSLIGQAPILKLKSEELPPLSSGEAAGASGTGALIPKMVKNEGDKWNNISFT